MTGGWHCRRKVVRSIDRDPRRFAALVVMFCLLIGWSPRVAASEDFSRSVQLSIDHEHQQYQDAAQRAVAAGDWPAVAASLAGLLSHPNAIVQRGDVLQPSTAAAALWIGQLPQSGLHVYQRLMEGAAETHFNAAITESSRAKLNEVMRLFPGTEAATRAETLLRSLAEDEADAFKSIWLGAASTERPRAPPSQKRVAESQRISWSLVEEWTDAGRRARDEALAVLQCNNLTPAPAATIVAEGDIVIVCQAQTRLGVNRHTGEVLWKRPVASAEAALLRASNGERSSAQRFFLSGIHRCFGDRLITAQTLAGERLAFVEPVNSTLLADLSGDERRWSSAPYPAQRLVCVDVHTGETLWTVTPDDDEPGLILGPPAACGDCWLGLVEIGLTGQLTLMAWDMATGERRGQWMIGQSLQPISRDPRRLREACPVVADQELALCSTGAGGLAAVEPGKGQLRWLLRIARDDAPRRGVVINDIDPGRLGFAWLSGWRAAQVLPLGEFIAWVTPESNFLHVIRRATGELVWRVERGDGLEIAAPESGAARQQIVICGARSARCFALDSGDVLWETNCPASSGGGVQVENDWFAPVGEFDSLRLSLVTGAMETSQHEVHVPEASADARCWRRSGGACWEAQLDRIELICSEDEERFDGLGAADQFAAALNRRRQQVVEPRWLAVEEIAMAERTAATQDERVELSGRLTPVLKSAAERARWRQWRVQTAILRGEVGAALDLWTSAPLDELDELVAGHAAGDTCRLDHWLQGVCRDQCEKLSADERSRREADWRRSWSAADPAERLVWRRRLGAFSAGAPPWVIERRNDASLAEHLEWRLQLSSLSTSGDAAVAAAATAELLREAHERGSAEQVDRWRARAESIPHETRLSDGRQWREWLDELPGSSSSSTSWPMRPPRVSARTASVLKYFGALTDASRPISSPLAGVSIEVDALRAGRLFYHASRWNQSWIAHFPPSNRTLRFEPELLRGWALEEVLILQLGSEVVAFSPWDETGARSDWLLWPQPTPPGGRSAGWDTLANRTNSLVATFLEAQSAPPGRSLPPFRRVNEFGYDVAAVGPATPAAMLLLQQGQLVAIDPVRGNELWRRTGIEPRAETIGDVETVCVWSPAHGTVDVLRTLDGRLLAERTDRWRKEEHFLAVDATWLIVEGALGEEETIAIEERREELPAVQLLRWSPRVDRELWRREFPPGSLPFELDEQWLGVWSPGGDVEVLSLADGSSQARHAGLSSEVPQRIYCSVGESDLLVMFALPPSDPLLIAAPQRNRGYRHPAVTGMMACFSREQGDLLWRRQLGDTVFPLDQPVDLPVWVTVEGRFPERAMDESGPHSGVAGGHGSRLRVYDRRTGDLLHEQESTSPTELHFRLTGDRERAVVELLTRNTAVEFDFRAPVEEPQPEQKE